VLHLYDDRVVHTVVPVTVAPVVTGPTSDVRTQLEALSPEDRRELVSRTDSPLDTGELEVPGSV
jgi:hypothetical protein